MPFFIFSICSIFSCCCFCLSPPPPFTSHDIYNYSTTGSHSNKVTDFQRLTLNWNPPSLLQISPTLTLEPSTSLLLVYSSYMYPPSSEERDSEKDGFKLDLFNTETGISMVTGELLPPDWLKQKSVCI